MDSDHTQDNTSNQSDGDGQYTIANEILIKILIPVFKCDDSVEILTR